MEQKVDNRRLVRLSPLILGAAVILFAVSSVYLTGFRVETGKGEYSASENVTASIIRFNYFPFPVSQPAVTRMEFSCTLNGEPLQGGYSAHLSPTGPFYFMPPGSGVWLEPITVTPHMNGTLVFTARIGSENIAIYEKMVKVNPAPLFFEKPAWLMLNRFNASSLSEPYIDPARVRIIDVEHIDFNVYPRLLEAFEVEEVLHQQYPHHYEWVNLTHGEGVKIVELFGGRYVARDITIEDYHFDIRYKGINYSVTVIFSLKPTLID